MPSKTWNVLRELFLFGLYFEEAEKFQNANKVKHLIGYSEANIDTAIISSQHSLGTCHN